MMGLQVRLSTRESQLMTTRRSTSIFIHLLGLLGLILAGALISGGPVSAQAAPGITSPATGSSVSGSVPVIGTATGEPFARYELYFKQEPSGDESYIWFAGDTRQVVNGQLGVWHTGDLAPGTYTLRLRIVRPDGNYGEYFARDIRVNLEPAAPTPTDTPSGPTPTPIPIATPTPPPQPTPEVVTVDQPALEEPTPTPTPEPVALGEGGGGLSQAGPAPGEPQVIGRDVSGGLGAAVSLQRLRERFFTGMRWSAGIFLLIAAVFAIKRLIEWALARAG